MNTLARFITAAHAIMAEEMGVDSLFTLSVGTAHNDADEDDWLARVVNDFETSVEEVWVYGRGTTCAEALAALEVKMMQRLSEDATLGKLLWNIQYNPNGLEY